MNVFYFTITLSIFIYGLFFETVFLKIYGGFLGFYFLGYLLLPNSKHFNLRRKLMIPCWKEQEEGNILARFQLDCTNFLKLSEKYPKDKKITLTHLMVRVGAELLRLAPETNGKIAFGKFVPFNDITISCLCDIDEGKDLGNISIQNADKLSLEEIRDIIKERAVKMKANKDQGHKELVGPFKYVPSFMIHFLLSLVYFITVTCVKNPAKKFHLGTVLVTNVGMLDVEDCYAPNNLASRCVYLLALNKIMQKPVAIDKKIEIRPMINLGVTIDHRFVDGARCKILNALIYESFEHPEKYLLENKESNKEVEGDKKTD